MNIIKQEGVALCPPIQLFRLINSVEHYPKFLSWCKEVTLRSRNRTSIKATVLINKYGISFHCPFTYTLRSNNEILVSLPSGGPFYAVSGLWRFQGLDNKTRFSFELQLDHKNTWWVNFFIIPILKNEVKSLIKVFAERASMLGSNKFS